LIDLSRYTADDLEQFAGAIVSAGSPMDNIIAFLDATFEAIAHPVMTNA